MSAKFRFLSQFPDATALIGNHPQGDEPGFHIPYLYNYAGEPWMTQRRVRETHEDLVYLRLDGDPRR